MGVDDRPEGNTVNLSRKLPSIDTTEGIQRRLNQTGFKSGKEDGIYGPITTGAVRRFQQFCKDNAGGPDPRIIDSGPVDGIAGPLTKAALLSFYGS
jgi:peptidoglycan hydrolase-like protein with peptidoglycan-binding domain